MDLGSAKLFWKAYTPAYRGNRDLPPAEQLSLELRRMRRLDVLGLSTWGEAELRQWAQMTVAPEMEEKDRPLLTALSIPLLTELRVFLENTRAYRNFIIDGEEETRPLHIFFHFCVEMAEAPASGFLAEISEQITSLARLGTLAEKNSGAPSDGSSTPKSTV